MSPIIYTPHACDLPEDAQRGGILWQCDICDSIWSADPPRLGGGWRKIDEPRRDQNLAEAKRRQIAQPATPRITPDMVELVLDTYSEHTELARDVFSGYTGCAVCGTGSYGPHTVRAHAREMAANVLQDALDKAGDTHE